MSVLASIANIKVPYPTEGVVRTAQLDDTIAPANSVQLAVNMNFDRVGAVQTRLGVTEYADDLVALINNFGTLRNSISTPAYDTIFQLGATEDIAVTFNTPSAVKINETKIAVFWAGTSSHGKARLYNVNQFTGAISAIGTEFEFDGTNGSNVRAILLDTDIVMAAWTGEGTDGFAQAFDVSGNTIVAYGTAFEFDTSHATDISIVKVNTARVLVFYLGASSDGTVVVLGVNPTTREVTLPGSPLVFDSTLNSENTCCAVGSPNTNRFVNFWVTAGGAVGQCFSVSGDTVTALDSPLSISTDGTKGNAMSVGDGFHVINAFTGDTGHFIAQTFAVNVSTGAITAVGTPSLIAAGGSALSAVAFGDGEHFMTFYATSGGVGFGQMMQLNTSTFALTMVGPILSGYDFQTQTYLTSLDLSENTVMAVWGDSGGVTGKAAMFQTLSDVTEGRWLYAGYSTKVANTPAPGGAWTDRRTGLATVSKPRFAQYLNRIWMVNGNQNVGGDPVATSTGGAFGDEMVPVGFPKGDFISAGFEGRIWVVNKTIGVIYYTDIVQFSAEGVYSLTYNANVNFLTTLSPETGETFTAIMQVPRALLIFTENTISRIYGASSVDAYPAYNVGTFSQESIVTTKTGIFFHHSSGFYQFDYGSQPVEISRRIIDFVKAIPRANYDDILGVYDGFDNVEWSVGQVVVEGVVFANCVLRYTISTQVWTVYDYPENEITAMIFFDDGVNLNHIAGVKNTVGATVYKTGSLDEGSTDFGEPFYFEFIDRWRAFTDMYYLTKSISGVSIYSENAAGSNLLYQIQKSGPNVWKSIGTVTEENTALLPNSDTDDFDVMRFRLVGNTKGAQVVVHGIEITQLTVKGQDQN